MKIYTIIGGVNGVGKSSFTGVLKSQKNDLGMIVDIDKITAQLGGTALEGGKQAIRIMENCIRDGLSFTQETTLSGRRSKAAARRAKEEGYYIRLYHIGLDTAEESKQRIANRVARGGHNISAEDVERRFRGRWDAVQAVLPYCDEVTFYDNNNGFATVAEYRYGKLIVNGDYQPKWIMELSAYLKDFLKNQGIVLNRCNRYKMLSMRNEELSHRINELSEYIMKISEHLQNLENTATPHYYEELLMLKEKLSDKIENLSMHLQELDAEAESVYRSLKLNLDNEH